MNELIIINTNEKGEQLISCRELYKFLESKQDFTTWIKGRISKYGFVENEDFTFNKNLIGKVWKHDYILNLNMAKEICLRSENNPKVSIAINQLGGDITQIHTSSRFEASFSEMLNKITGLVWERQYSIDNGKYFLDFKLGKTLIIEYNEKYHLSEKQQKKDKERIEYCVDWLAENDNEDNYRVPVIVVNKGEEYEGIHKIILHLVGFNVISSWDNEGMVSSIY